MVRINLIEPNKLADQHLLAEHVEILMLFTSAKKYNKNKIPISYRLGKGHINFFKNKLIYLENRFNTIQSEMRNRGYEPKATINKNIYKDEQFNDYTPVKEDYIIITNRIIEKLNMKPEWYTYYGKNKSLYEWEQLLK